MDIFQNFINRAELWRRKEEVQAILNGDVNTSGTWKDVYDGLRGKIKPMSDKNFAEEVHEELTGSKLIAESEVNTQDLTDIGLWEQTRIINQQSAVKTLDEAINEYGADEVINRTVNQLFDNFVEQGLVYKDVNDNIGFFHGKPKAYDIYDDSAFILFDDVLEEMSELDYWRFESAAPTMYQKFAQDIENKSDYESQKVIKTVAEASNYLEKDLESYLEFQEAFGYDESA